MESPSAVAKAMAVQVEVAYVAIAAAAAFRARSFALRPALEVRVFCCFAILLSILSLRRPIKNSFRCFCQTCRAAAVLAANQAFFVLQPASNTYPRIVSGRQGESNEFFWEIAFSRFFYHRGHRGKQRKDFYS